MKNKEIVTNAFSLKSMMLMALPSYFFPGVTAWLSGWFLQKVDLMNASFVSIAIPSLIATIITYSFFWGTKNRFKLENKLIRILLMLFLNLFLAYFLIVFLKLNKYQFDIMLSTVIGTVITAWKVPTQKSNNEIR
ncbi:hypothetical protein SAMN04489761_1885 [Tenacibaculum sp. MAR_2009_124]|uniref:hypothetical protein n=1 Tax=Tenacibaculum sp. MAR_2009_124 TaxID=1250059 RepID=UPI0008968024|nr:hypothetical protein [Tenacibaculum sp. MAR_2009_124]SEB82577.1 hypothetical protein SAMN04489761_1885 [Tenacibaculum sp. MAR_2009_124]